MERFVGFCFFERNGGFLSHLVRLSPTFDVSLLYVLHCHVGKLRSITKDGEAQVMDFDTCFSTSMNFGGKRSS